MVNIASEILKLLISKSKQHLLIPFYHAVSNTTPNFIGSLYPPRKIENFERDLDVLLELYEPISLQKLISVVKSGEKSKKRYFHLTFDDGLANFYEIVAPILIKRNIPATIFLNTNFIDNKELFYRYKVSLLLDNYRKSNDEIKNVYHQFISGNNLKETSVSKYLLAINYKNRSILDGLASKVNFSFLKTLEVDRPYLTKKQINELIGKGFTFGAHSVDHPFFPELTKNEQLSQAKESLKYMVEMFNLNYKAFSFPFADYGVNSSFFEVMNKNDFFDISFGTSGIKRDPIPNNFQRISFEIADSNLKYFLLKEYLKYFIKIPLGKSKMKR